LVPVLANFKIEQEGRQMLVIDGDGSVYRGVVDEENTLYKQVVTQKEQKLSAAYDNNLKFQSPKLGSQVANKTEAAKYYFLSGGRHQPLAQSERRVHLEFCPHERGARRRPAQLPRGNSRRPTPRSCRHNSRRCCKTP
jgi:hypothetical protein